MTKEKLKKEYEDGTVAITKDNISDYYEFMSDEEFRRVSILEILLDTFNKRSSEIIYTLFPGVDETIRDNVRDNYLLQDRNASLNIVYLQTIFGVKDSLKPTDEYIEDIKASSEYKEYISKSTLVAYIDKDRSDDINIVISFNRKGSGSIEVSNYEMADYIVSCFNDLKSNNSDDIFELIEEFQISQGV